MTHDEKEGFAQLEQRVAELETTVKDLTEIKDMLQMIIKHFGITKDRKMTVREADRVAERIMADIERKKRSKGGR